VLLLFFWSRLLTAITSPVFLSTLDNGTVVRSLAGIPSEGPVLYVGNHMLLGTELRPAAIHFLKEKNILLRGLAHPVMFAKKYGSKLPDMHMFDSVRMIGAVPVSNINFYKLLRSKAHVVLYPGGVREALHRKVMIRYLIFGLRFNFEALHRMTHFYRVKYTSCFGQNIQSL